MDLPNEVERERQRPGDDGAVFRALSMRPDDRSLALMADERGVARPGPRVVEIAPGAAVSAYSGPNFNAEPERADFLGGALICLTFSGLRASRVGNREFELTDRENCVALLSPDPIALASLATVEKTRKTVAAFISSSALDQLGVDLFGSGRDRAERLLSCPVTPAARGLAVELLKPERAAQARRFRAEALVLELLAELDEQTGPSARNDAGMPSGPAMAAVSRARDIIAANPSADHSLTSIAAAAGISVTTLKRDFQRTFGTSPIAYLRVQRLERGRSLIESDGLSIASAAYACGYGHPGNFAQAFRRYFGFAPSKLRR